MKYLKKFEALSDYESNMGNLILPNVSLITEDNDVRYNQLPPTPPAPPTPSHDFVEIGGIKWATMNVGATGVTDYGLYFAWGDTQGYTASEVGTASGQKPFKWPDYKYWTSDTGSGSSGITKYNSTDGLTTLQASDDAVTAAWGGNWRMPTISEFQALSAAVTTQWVTNYQGSGINGRLMTDKTDSSKVLFFPACGYAYNGSMYDVGRNGGYWSGSLYADCGKYSAYDLGFGNSRVYWQDSSYRYSAYVVRGVLGA